MHVVYWTAAEPTRAPFRAGSAGRVDLERAVEIREVEISPNSYHALFHFGIPRRLEGLPFEAQTLEPEAEVVFFPSSLEDAIARFYEAERSTYSGEFDILVREVEGVQYRLQLDRQEYQRTLIRLIDLFREAAHEGHVIRFSL